MVIVLYYENGTIVSLNLDKVVMIKQRLINSDPVGITVTRGDTGNEEYLSLEEPAVQEFWAWYISNHAKRRFPHISDNLE